MQFKFLDKIVNCKILRIRYNWASEVKVLSDLDFKFKLTHPALRCRFLKFDSCIF